MVRKCPECSHYVSDTVSVCPHCGFELNSTESPSLSHEEVSVPEVEDVEQPTVDVKPPQSVAYDAECYVEKKRNNKKLYVPIILGCIILGGLLIGLLNNNSPEESIEAYVVAKDSVAEEVDSLPEEPELDIYFTVIPIKCGKETDDINTSVVIDFPQTDNEVLQNEIVSFISNALTDDFTWGENPRPRYHGDLTDGKAIAEFFVNDKIREISEERAEDSIQSISWDEDISIKKVCETNRLVSYEVDFGGNHGGVGGGTNYGATFSKSNGNIIRVIAHPSDSKLRSLLIKSIHSHFDSDSEEMVFEEDLNKHPYPSKEPFITDKGVRFIYQKYEIGAGALGVVDITIPFSEIADYMTEEALSLIGYEKD